MSRGPSVWVTASHWTGFRPSRRWLPASLMTSPRYRSPETPKSTAEGAKRGRAGLETPHMPIQKLTSTDGFIAFDLDGAPAFGVVRLAPKVLRAGAALPAPPTTYAAPPLRLHR